MLFKHSMAQFPQIASPCRVVALARRLLYGGQNSKTKEVGQMDWDDEADCLEAALTGERTGGVINKLREVGGRLRHGVASLAGVFDADLANRRDVYGEIGAFLEKQLGAKAAVCTTAAMVLCGETDARLLGGAAIPEKRLVSAVRDLLLLVRVKYLRLPRGNVRRLEIFFLREGRPVAHTREVDLAWSELPPDVGDARLKEGEREVVFRLYPVEG